MSLYVAVYDIHPGDRKHFERLLTRISDSRTKESDILYIESYGSIEALLKTPQKYDVIIIDACSDSTSIDKNLEIADLLRKKEILIPLSLYLPNDYEPSTQDLLVAKSINDVFFYNKSIKTEDLKDILERGFKYQFLKAPKIELRDAKETYFVLPDDIVYAKMSDSFVNVYLSDGSCIRIIKDINDFIKDIIGYSQYMAIGKDTIINLNHVKQKLSNEFILDNGVLIKIPLLSLHKVNELYKKFKR